MIRNLVLCTSPFQSFVWMNLQEQYDIQNTVFVYVTSIDSERDRLYYAKARYVCESGVYLFLSGNVLAHILSIRAAFRKLELFDVQLNLYLASFNTFHSLYIFSALNIATVNIFDDGVLSLLSSDDLLPYRWNTAKLHLPKRMAYSLLLKYKNDQALLDCASIFYTIFPPKLIAFAGLTTLPVSLSVPSGKYAIDRPCQSGPIKVFIGDATHLYSDSLFTVYQKVLNVLSCEYYLQHPRDLRSKYVYSPTAVSSPLIAEEFIASLLSFGDDVYIYSFGSTALFTFFHANVIKTMIHHPGISAVSLIGIADHFSINVINSDMFVGASQGTDQLYS